MGRLIDAEVLEKYMCSICNEDYSDEPCEPTDCVFRNAIKNAPTIEAALVVHGRWIPVTERIPEKNVDVLVFNGHGFFVAQFFTWHIGSIGLDMWSMPQYCADPTHWMPLPEPPKEE